MRRKISVLVGTTLVVGAAWGQGVFDMGALTNTLSQGAVSGSGGGGAKKASKPRLPASALRYRSDVQARKRNAARFLAGLKYTDPREKERLRKSLASADVVGEIRQAIRPNGLDPDNLGDIMSLYLVSAWYGARGSTDSTPKDFKRVSVQYRDTLRSVALLAKLSNADKQATADDLMLRAAFNEQWVRNAKKQPAQMPGLKANIRKEVLTNFGMDVAKMKLGPRGLTF